MKIIRLEEGKAGKFFVCLENGLEFPLSGKECRNLDLEAGTELSEEQIEWMLQELVFVRGRNYLIHLLYSRDYTVKEVEEKLIRARYPQSVIDDIIEYGLNRHYLDDVRYAQDFIRCKKTSKSVRQLKYQLSMKGIPSSILDSIEEKDEAEELEWKVQKYWDKKTGTNYEKSAKTYQYFVRKGYDSSMIQEVIRKISYK